MNYMRAFVWIAAPVGTPAEVTRSEADEAVQMLCETEGRSFSDIRFVAIVKRGDEAWPLLAPPGRYELHRWEADTLPSLPG